MEVLHPTIQQWFQQTFGSFTVVQQETLPHVLAHRSVLVSSPTGTGKTLAAFLGVFDRLLRDHEAGTSPGGIVAIYVSPLRALTYDLEKNLQQPLAGLGMKFVRVGRRTGDTTARERAALKRRPPHILVTTPESLGVLMVQSSYHSALANVQYLIIDELHALAENKRGVQLMLLAESLEEIRTDRGAAGPLCRIGLSATVSPLTEVAHYLAGPGRPVAVVAPEARRREIVEVFSPVRRHPYPAAGYTAHRLLKELASLIVEKKTTLIFTNTRSGAESIGYQLKELLPSLRKQIEIHHASLDRSIRLAVEDRLKAGELRAVVCSATLELGIDIGSIDLVVMVSAPKGVARALQRIGRSGHSIHQVSHGILVATNINDLVECSATAKLVERRELEPVRIPRNSLDVLAQFIVSWALMGTKSPAEVLAVARRSYPFQSLSATDFERVRRYLEGGGASLEKAYGPIFGKVVKIEGKLQVTGTKVSREYFQNVGTILSESMVQVRLGRRVLGSVEEGFIKRLRVGDVFALNGQCVRLVQSSLVLAKVERARGEVPTVPRWNAAKMPLASGLAREVVHLRAHLAGIFGAAGEPAARVDRAVEWLVDEYQLSSSNAEAIARQMLAQSQISQIPTPDLLLVEVFADGARHHYFFHSLIGRSANDALSRVVAWRVRRLKPGNALVTIDDYGFLLTLRSDQDLSAGDLEQLLQPEGAEGDLQEALRESDLVKWQFRGVVQTGLMVPRHVQGRERKPRTLQWNSEILYEVLQKHEPDHPLLTEAYEATVHQFLDWDRARAFLEEAAGRPRKLLPVRKVSPLAFGIFVSKIKETMMMEDVEVAVERLYRQMYEDLGLPGESADAP